VSMDIEKWLSCLPLAEEHFVDGIVLAGQLLPSGPDEVRILAGDLCLTFLREDVLDAVPEYAQSDSSMSQPWLRIVVRKGASLAEARAKDLCVAFAPGKRPFALAVRTSIAYDPSPRFRELEYEFRRRHSLLDL
jgi:hypothetical protein